MSKKKSEFKFLGTLPRGKWHLNQYADGVIVAYSFEHPAVIIDNEGLKTFEERLKNAKEKN